MYCRIITYAVYVVHLVGGRLRSEERRVGKGVDLGGRRIIKKKKRGHIKGRYN